ncbi:MAG TPA: carbohydrate ABC transporter permease [Stackebrandtia sp.]|jgi:ABC-type glycerol-3-phosphate transport system permease component|uniref:carbohydrate ABC transporter permease n=1 Tax=Stackebrandtia sp. TaxID=2023065 RepID=UPI002D45D5BC|nr:carbohydrate ABC transporter permease [Stackebrandtia sp.]HZE41947.1 carbohydrate ABC transporter permease [Stackebrandtia sp.]
MSANRPAWMGKPSPLVKAVKAVALVVVVAVVLFPFWTIVATSIASPQEVVDNGGWVVIPTSLSFHAYTDVFEGGVITHALLISGGITAVGTLLSLVATVFLAYALSRPSIVGGKPVLLAILFTFLFPPAMIPAFLVVQELGLKEDYLSLILPVLVNTFNLVVMRGFFQNVPSELIEAARLDGAGDFRILTRVVMPLSKAVIAVIGLFYAVSYWNSFFTAILYMRSDQWPVQAVLRQYVTQGAALSNTSEVTVVNSPQSTKMAVVVMATIPIIVLYPFVQRFFAKGVLTGAIKSLGKRSQP